MLIKGVPNSIIDACEGLGDDSKTSQFNLTRVTLVINLKNGHKKYLSKIPFKSSCSHLKADAFHKPIFRYQWLFHSTFLCIWRFASQVIFDEILDKVIFKLVLEIDGWRGITLRQLPA